MREMRCYSYIYGVLVCVILFRANVALMHLDMKSLSEAKWEWETSIGEETSRLGMYPTGSSVTSRRSKDSTDFYQLKKTMLSPTA